MDLLLVEKKIATGGGRCARLNRNRRRAAPENNNQQQCRPAPDDNQAPAQGNPSPRHFFDANNDNENNDATMVDPDL